jgi:hypothetical protein
MRFTASARRHNISKRRARQAIDNAVRVTPAGISPRTGRQVRMILGHDDNGIALEIGVIYEYGRIVVIHAMELRPASRDAYEKAKNQ